MTKLDEALDIIRDVEAWVALAIARDAHPQAIQNAIDMHNRIRDFLGIPRSDWSNYVERMRKLYGEPKVRGKR